MTEATAALRTQAGVTLDELRALAREAETALGNVKAKAGDEFGSLRERLRKTFDEGKNTLGAAAYLAREQGARVDQLVRTNPYLTIGLTAAASFVFGYVLACTRRCRN
jgi:ElaB/YqjD/DUF883 family membrane-anchored ribosome-binding protein